MCNVQIHHAVFLLVVLLIGYALGVKFPSYGQSALGSVGL